MTMPYPPDPCPAGPRPRAWRAVPALLLLGAWLAVAACGYQQDPQALPAGARSLSIGRVNNLTGTGELDIRLRSLLTRRLSSSSQFQLRPVRKSDLEIRVDLTVFRIDRVLDPAIDTDRAFGFHVSGTLTLVDRRTRRVIIARRRLSATVNRFHGATVLETPAIRDEGITDVLHKFAGEVENQVLLVF